MGDTFKRGTAVIVLVTFLLVIIAPDYSFGEGVVDTKEFENAKIAYKNGDYDSAIKLFSSFIEKFEAKNQFKAELKAAYYYKAKIHFFGKEETEFITAITKLFELDLNYSLPKDEDLSFLQKAKDIQDAIRKRLDELKKIEESQTRASGVLYPPVVTPKPKKKIPWLLVAAGVVVVGVVIYFLVKPKKRTLTVTVGEGVAGDPASGTHIYKKGAAIKCNYSLKQGYTGLTVKLNGKEVEADYQFKMYSDHKLEVTASKEYTLTVTKGNGLNGTPDSGTYKYKDGDLGNYNYTLQAGYTKLTVTIDGAPSATSGTITMNGSHTLNASASRQYTLNVTMGPGVNGTPGTGSFTYSAGDVVSYSYSLQTGYKDLVVKKDGSIVSSSGSFIMNGSHTLAVSATKQYKLTVTRGIGVNGTPGSGTYYYDYGNQVNYNYSLQTGYKDLVVRLNGATVYKSGSITMNREQILTASAVEIDDPPTVSITNPKNGDTITGPIFVKVDTTDDKGINGVEFYIDGVSKRTITKAPYQWILDTTKYSNGSHTIKVIAYDTANQTASHVITVTVNN